MPKDKFGTLSVRIPCGAFQGRLWYDGASHSSGGFALSYLSTLTTAQLEEEGFAIDEDNPRRATHTIYPNLSVRHQCEECGNWSALFGGAKMRCLQCNTGKPATKETLQYWKVYLCCNDDDCPVRREAFQFLCKYGLREQTEWRRSERIGECVDISKLKDTLSEEQRSEFFAMLNEFTVSKFASRLLVHPDSKKTSKLPKRKR